jgi:hypothetical protein
MPKVGGKHYSYDKKGYRAAAIARMKKASKKMDVKFSPSKKSIVERGKRKQNNPYYDLGG